MAEIDLDDLAEWAEATKAKLIHSDTALRLFNLLEIMATAAVKQKFTEQQSPDGQPWEPLRFDRPQGGNVPLRSNGLLMASISSRQTPEGVAVGSALEHAAIHNYGGTIRPRKAKYLSIPLTREAARAASPTVFGGELKPRMWGKKTGKARGVLRDKDGTDQYLLVTHVDIPAREYLGFSDDDLKAIAEALAEELADALPPLGK